MAPVPLKRHLSSKKDTFGAKTCNVSLCAICTVIVTTYRLGIPKATSVARWWRGQSAATALEEFTVACISLKSLREHITPPPPPRQVPILLISHQYQSFLFTFLYMIIFHSYLCCPTSPHTLSHFSPRVAHFSPHATFMSDSNSLGAWTDTHTRLCVLAGNSWYCMHTNF